MNLTVENASFAYKKGKPVLSELSFSVSSGQLVAVLGPNGAGKTTLLRCMAGFLPWSAGRTLIDGTELGSIPSRQLWRRISYVPQARGNPVSLAVEDMILLGCTGRIGVFSSPGEEERGFVRSLAAELGISALLGRRFDELSGGEAQMVLIARALAAKPELLILDEPESNLDFKNRLIVLETLRSLAKGGMAVIFNTHYPEHALQHADRSLLLGKDGRALFGETDIIVTRDHIREAFGVETVVGEFEADGTRVRGILPVRLADDADKGEQI